jgi:soluble lytic murein transglycosylase-like protein
MGLMLIMPETYAELRLRHHLGADPYTPRDNVLAGAVYLRKIRDLYGRGSFLAGLGRYEDCLNRGRPLPEETRTYVAAIAP